MRQCMTMRQCITHSLLKYSNKTYISTTLQSNPVYCTAMYCSVLVQYMHRHIRRTHMQQKSTKEIRNYLIIVYVLQHWFILINDCYRNVLFPTLRALTVPRGEIVRCNDDNTSWCLVSDPSVELFCAGTKGPQKSCRAELIHFFLQSLILLYDLICL